MNSFKVFGRITGTLEECKNCIESFFESNGILACYEVADDGCSRDHCHFIATAQYKNFRSLRQSFSDKCFKILGEKLRYSVKEFDEALDSVAYICKGHKKDASVKPNIFINTYDINVEDSYRRFHKAQADYKENRKVCSVWKELIIYIEEVDPELFNRDYDVRSAYRIASHLYDWYLKKGKTIQGKYYQQNILRTVIANKWKNKTVKRSIIKEWSEDFQYFSSGEQHTHYLIQGVHRNEDRQESDDEIL